MQPSDYFALFIVYEATTRTGTRFVRLPIDMADKPRRVTKVALNTFGYTDITD